MDLSGVIFVLLAVAWAGYLIPKALRHHDEVARTRAIDRFSASTRVLAHSEPVDDRDTRLVVDAAPSGPRSNGSTRAPAAAPGRLGSTSTAASVVPSLSAARAAARRRRRILGVLLLGVLATVAAASLDYLPWWSVAVPAGLTVAYLVLCRTQVRREHAAVRPRAAGAAQVPATAPSAAPAPVPVERTAAPLAATDAEDSAGTAADVGSAGFTDAAHGTIWDPLPVTLPTYVTAPKAHRTVRTIDLGEPGTWTSGRTAEDAEIAVQAGQPDAPDEPGRRAVGS